MHSLGALSKLDSSEATMDLSSATPTTIRSPRHDRLSPVRTSPAVSDLMLRQSITSPRLEATVTSARSARSEDSRAGISSQISIRQLEWDKEAASADQKQAELFHMQWSLFRDQISTFSSEMINMKRDIQKLQVAEDRQRKDLQDFAEKEEKAVVKVETSLKGVIADIADIRRILQSREFIALEERLNNAMQDVKRQLDALQDTFESDRREHSNTAERTRKKLVELGQGLDDERAQRTVACDSFEKEMHRLRSALEDEGRKRATGDSDLTVALDKVNRAQNAIDITMQSLVSELNSRMEEEAKARSVGDHRQDKLLEEFRHECRAGIDSETNSRKADISGLAASLQSLRTSLDQETLDRTRADERSTDAFHRISTSLEKETKERISADDTCAQTFKDAMRALEQERNDRIAADETLKWSITTEEQSRAAENKALQGELSDCRGALTGESKARSSVDEENRKIMAQIRSSVEQEERARIEDFERLASQLRESSKINTDNFGVLKQDVTNISIGLEAEIAERGKANERFEKSLADLSEAWRRDREALIAEDENRKRLHQLENDLLERSKAAAILSDRVKALQVDMEGLPQMREQMKTLLESESNARSKGVNDIFDRIKLLSDALETERNERRQGQEEVSRLAAQAKGLIDKECREWQAAEEETARRIQELFSRIDQEVADRSTGEHSLRGQVAGFREELLAEKDARTHEVLAARHSLQNGLEEIKHLLQLEKNERLASVERWEQQSGELVEKLNRYGIEVAETQRSLASLRQSIDDENKERIIGDEEVVRMTLQIKNAAEKEVRDRRLAEEDLSKKIQAFADALLEERTKRDSADVSLRGQLENCRQELKVEQTERIKIINDLVERIRLLSNSLSDEASERARGDDETIRLVKQTKELLEQESRERHNIDEDLAKQIPEMKSRLEKCQNQLCIDAESLQAFTTQLRLEQESRSRAVADTLEQLKTLSDTVQTESEARLAGDRQNEQRCTLETSEREKSLERLAASLHQMRQELSNSLDLEVSERIRGDEESARLCLDAKQTIDKEVRERRNTEEGFGRKIDELRSAIDQGIAVERGKRQEETAAGHRDLQKLTLDLANEVSQRNATEQRLENMLKTIKVEVEASVHSLDAKLQSCSSSLSRETEDRRAGDETCSAQLRILQDQHLQDRIADLRHKLEEEVIARRVGDEGLEKTITELSATLQSEVTARDSEIGALGDASRSLQARLNDEARKRADELAEALRQIQERLSSFNSEHLQVEDEFSHLKDALEGEVSARSRILKEIEARLDEEVKAREQGDELEGKLLQKLRTSLELEIKERSQGITSVFEQIQQLGAHDNPGLSESQLREMEAKLLATFTARITANNCDLETKMAKTQSSITEEVARLWEAMDTHTHDVEMDSDEEVSRKKVAIEKTSFKNTSLLNTSQSFTSSASDLGAQSLTQAAPLELLAGSGQIRIERPVTEVLLAPIQPLTVNMPQQAPTSGYRSAPTPIPFAKPAFVQPAFQQNVGMPSLNGNFQVTRVRPTTPEATRRSSLQSFPTGSSSFPPPIHLQAKPPGQTTVHSATHFVAAQNVTPRQGSSLSALVTPKRSASATSLTAREVSDVPVVVARSHSIGRSSMHVEVTDFEMSTHHKDKAHTARYHVESGGRVDEPHDHHALRQD